MSPYPRRSRQDSEAVALCQSRLAFVDDALHRRYALAEAHFVYLLSLKSVSVSIHRFFNSAATGDLASTAVHAAPSPALNIPENRKIEPEEEEHPRHHLISFSTRTRILRTSISGRSSTTSRDVKANTEGFNPDPL